MLYEVMRKERSGIHRYPEPKILAGSNYCDIGFERDPHSNRLVVISAIDNLVKGAAGQAVQAFNIALFFSQFQTKKHQLNVDAFSPLIFMPVLQIEH